MELVTEPDLYSPSIDNFGNYIDKTPSFNNIKCGIRCPCGTRRDKTYDTSSAFSTHTKSKSHKKWLDNLNLNKTNYYVENEKLKQIVQDQRMIIAKMDIELQNKITTIDYLTKQLIGRSENTVDDLLNFD